MALPGQCPLADSNPTWPAVAESLPSRAMGPACPPGPRQAASELPQGPLPHDPLETAGTLTTAQRQGPLLTSQTHTHSRAALCDGLYSDSSLLGIALFLSWRSLSELCIIMCNRYIGNISKMSPSELLKTVAAPWGLDSLLSPLCPERAGGWERSRCPGQRGLPRAVSGMGSFGRTWLRSAEGRQPKARKSIVRGLQAFCSPLTP